MKYISKVQKLLKWRSIYPAIPIVFIYMFYNKIANLSYQNLFKINQHPIPNMKYILQWTSSKTIPFVYLGSGQKTFIDRKCRYTNCYVTNNRELLEDYTKFDVIAFAGPEVLLMEYDLPEKRSPHQKFVFASIESSGNYPACYNQFLNFFNWSWTYRLDSDSRWGYITVRDSKGNVVGPKKDMHWIKHKDMQPVTKELKEVLRRKTKAVAWFVSNCNTLSRRELLAISLKRKLTKKYNVDVDIFGLCSSKKCSRSNETMCGELLRKNYYFYLSFENSLSEDYVTEKLLHALRYNAIPIVLGGANYSRFLPEKSYLDITKLGIPRTAKMIYKLMNNIDEYSEYFRWTNHYSFHSKTESAETDDYCGICELLNDKKKMETITIYKNISEWWNSPHDCWWT